MPATGKNGRDSFVALGPAAIKIITLLLPYKLILIRDGLRHLR